MKRATLWLLLAALAPALAGATTSREWRFTVSLDEREVGSHRFRVIEREGERRVKSDAHFTVKVLFIDAYTYVHQAREHWYGDCLQAIESQTNDNGERLAVRGARRGGQFQVIATDGRADLAGCVMSFAYWNPAILGERRLLNAQTGELTDVRVEPLGEETVMVRGTPVVASRYALRARNFRIDVWYASGDEWVKLESRTDGGRVLRYRIQ
jgi:hypothetical protein